MGGKNGHSPVVGLLDELANRTGLEEKPGVLVITISRLLPLLLLGSLGENEGKNRG